MVVGIDLPKISLATRGWHGNGRHGCVVQSMSFVECGHLPVVTVENFQFELVEVDGNLAAICPKCYMDAATALALINKKRWKSFY